MKTQEFKSLGLVVKLQVPATVKEFDDNAKKVDACLAEAINNVVYRGSLAEFRDLFIHGQDEDKENNLPKVDGAETKFKLDRKTKDTGRVNDKKEPILAFAETESEYVDRLLAHLVKDKGLTEEVAKAELQKHADTIASHLKFDASQRERKPAAPKKLAQKYKDTAAGILKGHHLDRFIKDVKKNLSKDWVRSTDKDKAKALEADTESLGWLVKEYSEWKEKQDLAALVG